MNQCLIISLLLLIACGGNYYQQGGCDAYQNVFECRELNDEEIIWFYELLHCLQIEQDFKWPSVALVKGDLPCGKMQTSAGCYKNHSQTIGINSIYYEEYYREIRYSEGLFKHESTHYIMEKLTGDLDPKHTNYKWQQLEECLANE